MITTPDLIESLAARAEPVRRLRPPLVRAAAWLLFAGLMVVLMAAIKGLRPDLGSSLEQPRFAIDVAAALATGILAAVAAFVASLPDRSRLWLWLPVPALLVWVANIGHSCLTAWVDVQPGMHLGDEARHDRRTPRAHLAHHATSQRAAQSDSGGDRGRPRGGGHHGVAVAVVSQSRCERIDPRLESGDRCAANGGRRCLWPAHVHVGCAAVIALAFCRN
jgi:hypothetical protein